MLNNHSHVKLLATVITIIALFVTMGIAWGTTQADIQNDRRRITTLESANDEARKDRLEILVGMERLETKLNYVIEQVSDDDASN